MLNTRQSSSEKQIKRRYKDLSLIYHPDKARPDESKNQTLDTINDYWVDLSKAYKALTDEEVRNNFVKFGHPDGRQSFSIGIALPKFIITDGNGKYVLLVYGLLLGVLLPYIVGKWWYGSQRMTREKVLIASAGKLFREYTEDMNDGDAVYALSCAEEFQEVLKGNEADSGTGKIEQIVAEENDLGPSGAGFTKDDLTKLKALDGVRRKVVALLWAYLGRKRVDGSTLDDGELVCIHLQPILMFRREVGSGTSCAGSERIITGYCSRIRECSSRSFRVSNVTELNSGYSSSILSFASTSSHYAVHCASD